MARGDILILDRIRLDRYSNGIWIEILSIDPVIIFSGMVVNHTTGNILLSSVSSIFTIENDQIVLSDIPNPPAFGISGLAIEESTGDLLAVSSLTNLIYRFHNASWDTGIAIPSGAASPAALAIDQTNGDLLLYAESQVIYRYSYSSVSWDAGDLPLPVGVANFKGLTFDPIANEILGVSANTNRFYRRSNDVWDVGIATLGNASTAIAFDNSPFNRDRDSIYILSENMPATPAGGTDTEEHTPAGWTRTEPLPTDTENVWRSRRTRSFEDDDSFIDATAWEEPTEHAHNLFDLTEFITPDGHEIIFAAFIEVGESNEDRYNEGSSVGSIIAGDLNLSINSRINRFRVWSSPDRIQLNETGSDRMDTLLEAGGDLNDATLHIQDADGVVSQVIADIDPSRIGGSGFNVDATLNAAMVSKSSDLSSGDRVIIAFTRPSTSIPFDSDAEIVSWLFNIPGAIGQTLSPPEDSNAEVVSWLFDVPGARGQAVSPPESGEGIAEVVSWLFNVPGARGQPFEPSTAMYDEYNLGDKLTSGYDFSVSILLDPRLIEGGATAYLRFFDNSGSSARLRLSSGPTSNPNDLGPSFADYLIVADEAIILYSDVLDDEFILKGPNHPANGFSDPTEPYFWTPDNGVEFAAWWTSFTGDVSIRFLLPEEATGGRAEVVSWLFDVPGARGQAVSPPADSSAEVVSWFFTIPGAIGQTLSPPEDSNAEVVSWLFTIPGAIGQTLSPPEDSNAEVVSWLFDVPGARGQAISPPESGEGIAEVVSWLFNVPGAIGQTLSPPEDSNAEVVSWLFDVPGSIGQAAIPFTLSQFVIPSGQQIVFAGLIEIGVSGEDRYRPGTNVGSLLDGDLNLAPDLTINRLRVRSGPRLTFNRSGAGTFMGYLEGTGDYADGTIHIQNSEGVTSQLISSIPAADITKWGFPFKNSSNH